MKIIGINGSPRKTGNTAELIKHALRGAESQNAETELINLYDYTFKGCISCFSCKLRDGKSYGKCAVKDELTEVIKKISESDGVIFGSPIYFADVTALMRSLIERLLFPFLVYDKNYSSIFGRKIDTGFIYDMNVKEEFMLQMGYGHTFETNKRYLSRIFGSSDYITVHDTLQFDDYSKYVVESFDPVAKAQRHRHIFPDDCQRAYELGERVATEV